jgi:hypothetical protein
LKKLLFASILLWTPNLWGGETLVNPSFIQNCLTKEAQWSVLHGAQGDDLGSAMFYYAIVYANKYQNCVCLGSGDGFVPRVMRQAQRDLHLTNSKTILVDGELSKWGKPSWKRKDSLFRKEYPEVEIIMDTTHNVALNQAKEWEIDYLHIDADRSTMGALKDFLDYLPYMSKNGTITLHETGPGRPCAITLELIRSQGYSAINYAALGTGVAIIKLETQRKD